MSSLLKQDHPPRTPHPPKKQQQQKTNDVNVATWSAPPVFGIRKINGQPEPPNPQAYVRTMACLTQFLGGNKRVKTLLGVGESWAKLGEHYISNLEQHGSCLDGRGRYCWSFCQRWHLDTCDFSSIPNPCTRVGLGAL